MDINQMMYNPYAWLVLSFVAIASFVFGIYTWIKGKRKKELSYICNSQSIIQNGKSGIENLNITYKDQQIRNLYVKKYTIWNSGNEVINDNDIVESKCLSVNTVNDNTSILDVKIVNSSEPTNKFQLTKIDEHQTNIKFDYMNQNDGIALQVIYTGEIYSVYLDCKIKGGSPIKCADKSIVHVHCGLKKQYQILTWMLEIGLLSTFIPLIISLLVMANFEPISKIIPDTNPKVSLILFGIMFLIYLMIYYLWLKRILRIHVPSKLREKRYDDEDFDDD